MMLPIDPSDVRMPPMVLAGLLLGGASTLGLLLLPLLGYGVDRLLGWVPLLILAGCAAGPIPAAVGVHAHRRRVRTRTRLCCIRCGQEVVALPDQVGSPAPDRCRDCGATGSIRPVESRVEKRRYRAGNVVLLGLLVGVPAMIWFEPGEPLVLSFFPLLFTFATWVEWHGVRLGAGVVD